MEGLDALMSESAVTAYIGFDCTADSLHVGSLLPIMLLHLLLDAMWRQRRLWRKAGRSRRRSGRAKRSSH